MGKQVRGDALRRCKCPVTHPAAPTPRSIPDDSAWVKLYCKDWKWQFANSILPPRSTVRTSRNSFPLCLSITVSVNSWILTSFNALQPTIVLVYSSTQIIPAWPLGAPSSWLPSPVDVPHPASWAPPAIRAQQNVPGFSIFPSSALGSAISQTFLVPLSEKWYLETKIWAKPTPFKSNQLNQDEQINRASRKILFLTYVSLKKGLEKLLYMTYGYREPEFWFFIRINTKITKNKFH